MQTETKIVQRVIGFDAHPDTFTAAVLTGPTPAAAVTEKVFNKLSMRQLQAWAKQNVTESDLIVLEASGNSFQIVRSLREIGRKAVVLESWHLGKLKEAHANNDKISAVRIGTAYLAGTAREVWVPDSKTQERRDCYHAHRKASKRTTQLANRLQSYLSDNGVRLPIKKGTRLAKRKDLAEHIQKCRAWSPIQQQIIQGLLLELEHAEKDRQQWRSLIAQEVLSDPTLLSIARLCGAREMIAFAAGAFIGDITRFSHPKKLVKYIGLNPAFDQSGNGKWEGGIGGHGHKELRCLLIEGAQAVLRSSDNPLAKWGRRLLARKGARNLVVAAMARKLAIALWYLMMGRWTQLEDIELRLALKVSKMISQVGAAPLKKLGKKRADLRLEVYDRLLKGRDYLLDPNKTFLPKTAQPATAAAG